jgi:membrane-associated phospholipid phosphatase
MHAARIRVFSLITMLSILSGCGTMSNGKGWGQDATLFPGWSRVGKAAYQAAVSPLTWGPAVGAAILQIDDWDRNLSRWASDKRPIFGSQTNASNWSDYLLFTSGAVYGATALLTPSGNQSGEWVTNKMKGFIVGGAALGLSEAGVGLTSAVIKRKRPDGGSNESFPSGHAAAATSFATLAARNVGAMELPRPAEVASDIGLGVLAAGTAWARVEAKRHYPSDVLFGITLGHFLSAFVNDAFLGTETSRGVTPEADISRDGFHLGVSWNF